MKYKVIYVELGGYDCMSDSYDIVNEKGDHVVSQSRSYSNFSVLSELMFIALHTNSANSFANKCSLKLLQSIETT